MNKILRKYRWTMEIELEKPILITLKNKPTQIGDSEIIVSFLCDTENQVSEFFLLLQDIWDLKLTQPVPTDPEEISKKSKIVVLKCESDGEIVEYKKFRGFPIRVNFGDLDFSMSDLVEIEVAFLILK